MEHRLWNDASRNSLSLGCVACSQRGICGGLSAPAPIYDCLDHCCGKPSACDSVCVNNQPKFAEYVREIRGFELENIPQVARVAVPALPPIVPLLYHGYRRKARFAPDAVCLKLYDVVAREGELSGGDKLARRYKFKPGTLVLLSGTSQDDELEDWWELGETRRRRKIRKLKLLGVDLVTTPNFSMFLDRPRWDDLHSMKRIATTHAEFQSEGLAAALHLNGSAERDWERWASFISQRRGVSHVAFEFGTGSRHAARAKWHVKQLARLAKAVKRPLHLVVRGGGRSGLKCLHRAFAGVTLIDTNLHMKTHHRRYVQHVTNGRAIWNSTSTEPNEPLDELLEHNWLLVKAAHRELLERAGDEDT